MENSCVSLRCVRLRSISLQKHTISWGAETHCDESIAADDLWTRELLWWTLWTLAHRKRTEPSNHWARECVDWNKCGSATPYKHHGDRFGWNTRSWEDFDVKSDSGAISVALEYSAIHLVTDTISSGPAQALIEINQRADYVRSQWPIRWLSIFIQLRTSFELNWRKFMVLTFSSCSDLLASIGLCVWKT